MKESQKLPAGSMTIPQASAGSNPMRAVAAPPYRKAGAASLSVSGSVSSSTASSVTTLSSGVHGAAAPTLSCARRKDRSPPLVTRSNTAQIPPGVIITKQVLVRVKPCPANRGGVGHANTSDPAASASRNEVLATPSNARFSSVPNSLSSTQEGKPKMVKGKSSHSSQQLSQHETSAAGGLRGTQRDITRVTETLSAGKTSVATAVSPVASADLPLRKDTGVAPVHDTMKVSYSARKSVINEESRDKANPAGTNSSRGGKNAEKTGFDKSSGVAPGAVNASNLSVKDSTSTGGPAAAQQHFQQCQGHTQNWPSSSQRLTQQHGPPQQHSLKQQRPMQEQLLPAAALPRGKEQLKEIKAEKGPPKTAKAKPKTKVVVRLLPPSVSEDELLALVPAELKKQITWKKFYPGSHVTASAGDGDLYTKTSFWFLNCESPAAAEALIKIFHSKCFVDERHTTFKAIAALAPYQKTPRKKATENKLEGQIEEEPLYAAFFATLTNKVSVDGKSLLYSGMEERELLRDDDGAPITAMLLETRERYNVKTTVNGHLYTLAMWRQDMGLLDEASAHGESC